jgi:hypothetical protein
MQVRQQINEPKIISRASLRQRLTGGAVLLAILGVFAFFHLGATGRIDLSDLVDPCGFKQQYNLPCPTCGMTTASLAFVKGRVFQAFYIQPAAALAWLTMSVVAFFAFLTSVLGLYFVPVMRFLASLKTKHVILILIVIIVAAWSVTLARAIAAG